MIQAYLYRSRKDIEGLCDRGIRVRLCKGAYLEPASVAFPRKPEVDRNFVELMKLLLDRGAYPAIATHDEALIEETKAYAASKKISRDAFEFQMLYGIRRDLQRQLVRRGLPPAPLRPVRQGLVPVLHASSGGAAGQRAVYLAESAAQVAGG